MNNTGNNMMLWLSCALDAYARLRRAISDLSITVPVFDDIRGAFAAFGVLIAPVTMVVHGSSVPIWRERPFDPLI